MTLPISRYPVSALGQRSEDARIRDVLTGSTAEIMVTRLRECVA